MFFYVKNCNSVSLFPIMLLRYAVTLSPQIADLARKLRKERRERERLENLGISGPVPDTPPDDQAAAPAAEIAAAPKSFSSSAAAAAAAPSQPKRPGAGYQSAYRTVSPSFELLNWSIEYIHQLQKRGKSFKGTVLFSISTA